MVKFKTPKINKIQDLPGASPPDPKQGRCPGPTGGLKAVPRPHAFEEKNPYPLTRIPGSAPDKTPKRENIFRVVRFKKVL